MHFIEVKCDSAEDTRPMHVKAGESPEASATTHLYASQRALDAAHDDHAYPDTELGDDTP